MVGEGHGGGVGGAARPSNSSAGLLDDDWYRPITRREAGAQPRQLKLGCMNEQTRARPVRETRPLYASNISLKTKYASNIKSLEAPFEP
jgi:hypothetical protein